MSAPISKDQARTLLGGYATGSLTEVEQTALFQAALEDQELFDELAGEQVLKEVLDQPGARERLITALEPPRKYRAWLWAAAAAAVAIVIGIVVTQRTPPPPQQIAQVMKSPEPVNAPAAPPVVEPPRVRRKVAPAPQPKPPAELKKEENGALAERADQIQEVKPQAAAGAVRQFAAARATGTFAFDYAVRGDGFLEMIPAAPGFLFVMTPDNGVIFPTSSVSAGTPIRIRIPSDEPSSLIVTFSRTQGLIGSPVRRDALSGTVTDQDPPNGKILIRLSLTPATR